MVRLLRLFSHVTSQPSSLSTNQLSISVLAVPTLIRSIFPLDQSIPSLASRRLLQPWQTRYRVKRLISLVEIVPKLNGKLVILVHIHLLLLLYLFEMSSSTIIRVDILC